MSIPATTSPLQGLITKKMTRRAWLLILICVPVIIVAVYYTPLLMSLGWHVMHGSAVDYRGLRVQVPFGWVVNATSPADDYPANPQGIMLEKQQKTLGFYSPGPETMYFNLLQPDGRSTPQEQVAEWERLFLQSHPASDFDTAHRNDLSADMDCIEAIPHASHSASAMACISRKHGWVAQFAGSRENVPLFLKTLDGLKQRTRG
ncbi:MAG TPA: hypothetical protein VHT28_08140 [Silvibacterium sp.]|nr:hypothetical protein [Silvibacterium sp.]